MPSPEGDHIMDSAFIHQAANELVQTAGTRNIKQIARSCSLDISETSRIKDMLGLLSLYFDKPLILINRQLDKPVLRCWLHCPRHSEFVSALSLFLVRPTDTACGHFQ